MSIASGRVIMIAKTVRTMLMASITDIEHSVNNAEVKQESDTDLESWPRHYRRELIAGRKSSFLVEIQAYPVSRSYIEMASLKTLIRIQAI